MKHFLLGKCPGVYRLFNRNILLVMRLTILLLIASCFVVQASSYAQKVTLSVRNAGIESVCIDIKKQSGFFFLYDAAVLKKSGTVSLELKNVELEDALRQMTAGKALGYRIIDKTVIISETKAATNSNAEDITITGTVRSKEGPGKTDLPLPGVTIAVKGTSKAVSSDGNGAYRITAPANATLVFAMIGFGTKEVAINSSTNIDMVLLETASDLHEIIVTAYGSSERKENQIGSAVQLTSVDLQRKPLNRIDQLLEGMVAGLQYEAQAGGTSTARPRFQTRIRGEASFSASNEPLWVLDGIPLNTGDETNLIPGINTSISPLTYLNPNDIESIVVLKDATATSIYGADGSNGVVLITTKKGQAGKRNINYSFRTGINLINDSRFHVLNGDQYRELYRESYLNNTSLDPAKMPDLGNTNTDWYDVFFRNGITTAHDISLSGGNKKTRYYISGGYFDEKPIMIENQTQRFSGRINIDHTLNKSINLFLRVGGSYNVNNLFYPGDTYYNNRPIDSPFDANGNYVMAFYNQLADAKLDDDVQRTKTLQGSVGGTVKILPWLSFTTTNGLDLSTIRQKNYRSMYTFSERNNAGYMLQGKTNFVNWNSQHRINFDKTINQHSFSALLGGEARSQERRSYNISGSGFPNDDVRDITYATRNVLETNTGDDKTSISYYGQLRYTLANKYSLLGSFRRDANSDFGSDVKWATFNSVGASWTLSNEKFWKIKQIDFAKLKLSYGSNGNSRIGAYKSKGIYKFDLDHGYNGQEGAVMSSGENPLLSWETTYIINGGLSVGLFKRISMEVEFYQNTTKGMLDAVDVTRTTGFTRILQNIGSVRNSGIEITLNTQNIVKDNFEWRTKFNIAHNRNKILKLYNGNDKILDKTIRRVGEDANTFYLIRWAGVDPRDGGPLWYDRNNNVTKEFDLNNRVALGSSTPDFFGGMTNTITYKDFSLSALLIYNVGGYGFSDFQRDAESDGRNLAADNQSTNLLDRWREPGDLSNIPKSVLFVNENNGRNSTRFLHKKTSLRLQNISLNYNLPKKWVNKAKIANASVYFQADNVGFWTPYSTPSNRNDFRNSFNPYPQPLVLSFGLNVGF